MKKIFSVVMWTGTFLSLFTLMILSSALAWSSGGGECRSSSEEVMFSWDTNSPLGWKVSYKDNRDIKGKNLRLICVVKDMKTKQFVLGLFVATADLNGVGELSDTKQIIKSQGSVYGFNHGWTVFGTKVMSSSTLVLKEGFSVEKYCVLVVVRMKGDKKWKDWQYVAVAFINDNKNPNRRYLITVAPNTRISKKKDRKKTCEVVDTFLKNFRHNPKVLTTSK